MGRALAEASSHPEPVTLTQDDTQVRNPARACEAPRHFTSIVRTLVSGPTAERRLVIGEALPGAPGSTEHGRGLTSLPPWGCREHKLEVTTAGHTQVNLHISLLCSS